MRPSRSVVARLADEIERAGAQGLLPNTDASVIARCLRGEETGVQVELSVPITVLCSKSTGLADFSLYVCKDGGRVVSRRQECRGRSVPAPVWVLSAESIPNVTRRAVFPDSGVRIALSLRDYASIHGGALPERIYIRDRARPIAEMRVVVGGRDEEIYGFMQRGSFRYLLSIIPTESITKPVSITAFSYNPRNCVDLDLAGERLNGVHEVLFCRDLEVLQATVAHRAGHPRMSSRNRAIFMDGSRDRTTGRPVYRLHVRYLRTCGLVVRADMDEIGVASQRFFKSKDKGQWIGLHTLSHGFLARLPQATGLESGNFAEALSVEQGEVAVYDNSPGGLGGVEGIIDEESGTLDPNYEDMIRGVHICPLECLRACKACLFTDSCYMLNWGLDRRILIQLGW